MGNDTGKTVIRQCLNWLNWPEWISSYLDYRTPKLTCSAAVTLLLEAQISGHADPEIVVENLRQSEELKSLTKLTSISASQLSRKLAVLPTWLLQYLFQQLNLRLIDLLKDQGPPQADKDLEKLSLIDSTSISLPEKLGKWAYCSKSSNGVTRCICV